MFEVLTDRVYRRLYFAQVIALTGTGLLTVALALLAYQIAGADAGVLLGTALAIKMIAYVGVAPIVGAFADRLPRRAFLVSMDVLRAAIAGLLPFVDQVWQIYALIFVLQAASAGFTPTFQATIPDVLPEEARYTRALSLSRIAYDLESLLSPMLAAALLGVMGFHWLFAGTCIGFLASAALVLSIHLPRTRPVKRTGGVYDKITRGLRIYLKTPRLKGLLALNMSVAAAGAMVIVNTIVIVRLGLQRPDTDVALALAASGAGSMIAALALPRLLDRMPDRPVMLCAACGLVIVLAGAAGLTLGDVPTPWTWPGLLAAWFALGLCTSAVMTPSGRLLRRSSTGPDRPAVFAAQFALSHACWLITYPLAGWLGQSAGIAVTFVVMCVLSALGAATAYLVWPVADPRGIVHDHPGIPSDHPHLSDAAGGWHAHDFVIDDLHRRWPSARP